MNFILAILVGFIGAALILMFIGAVVGDGGRAEKRKKVIEKYGEPNKTINEHALWGGTAVYVYESQKLIVIDDIEYRFEDIIDFSLNGNQSYKMSTSTANMIGRSVAGGLLFGGVGALAGAATATKKISPNNGENIIHIVLNNINSPMIEYRIKNATMAQEFMAILKIIVDRNNKSNNE